MDRSFWAGLGIAIFSLAFEGILGVFILIGWITQDNAFWWLIILAIVAVIGISILIWSLLHKKQGEGNSDIKQIIKTLQSLRIYEDGETG